MGFEMEFVSFLFSNAKLVKCYECVRCIHIDGKWTYDQLTREKKAHNQTERLSSLEVIQTNNKLVFVIVSCFSLRHSGNNRIISTKLENNLEVCSDMTLGSNGGAVSLQFFSKNSSEINHIFPYRMKIVYIL